MATFTGQLISATYDAILKSIDNDPLGSVAKQITDGLGNVTPLYISTTQIGIGITPTEALHVSGNIIGTGTLAITGLTTFGTLKSNLATGATIGEFITEAQGIAANNNDTTLPTSAAVKDYVDSGNTGQVTGSGTGGKLPIWTGIGASSTLSDSAITEESTRFVLTKDIFINEGIPVLTLSDSNSTGSATLGDIIWQDNTATQRAIISLYNNNLAITSKQGGLTFGTASTTAMTIDATQNAIFNSNLDVTGDFAVNTDKFTVNAVNGNSLVAGTLGVTSTLTSADITTGNISAGNVTLSGGITQNATNVTNTFKSGVLIAQPSNTGQQSILSIGSNAINDVVIGFQTDGNSMSMGIDRSDSNAFKISDSNAGLGTNDRFKIDTTGAAFFTGLVSGITPTAAANFVTKEYIDGGGGAGSGFLPLTGGTLTGTLTGTTANFTGNVGIGVTADASVRNFIKGSDDSTNNYQILTRNSSDANILAVRNDGNVGIGTTPITSPNGADTSLSIFSGQDCGIILKDSVETWEIYQNDDLQFSFGTTPTTVMTMQRTTGNVGIGVTGPSSKFQVEGAPANGVYLSYLYNSATHNSAHGLNIQTSSNNILTYGLRVNTAGDSNALAVMGNGDVGIGTDSPNTKLTVKGAATAGINQTINIETGGSAAGDGGSLSFTLGSFLGSYPNWRIGQIGAIYEETNSFKGALVFKTSAAADGGVERMRIDSGGSVSIGGFAPSGTPTADYRSLEIGRQGNTITGAPWKSNLYFSTNATITAGSTTFTARYLNELPMLHTMEDGIFAWSNAVLPTAVGNTVVWNERMRIESDGTSILRGLVKINTGAQASNPRLYFQHDNLNVNNFIEVDRGTGAMEFYNNGSEAMRITSGRNVGIGTDSPKAKLDVFRAAGQSSVCAISITTGESNNRSWGLSTEVRAAGDFALLVSPSASTIPAPTDDNIRMYMTSGGDLALGMQDYNANPSSGNYGLRLETGATGKSYWQSAVNAATSHYHYEFINTNGSVGTIRTLNSATSYVTNSDYRLKEDLQDFNGLDKVSKIPVYNFKWKIDDTRSYGVMAHELDVVLPDAVSGEKDDVNEDKSINPQGVDYSKIVPLLVKSIQELEARLKILENK